MPNKLFHTVIKWTQSEVLLDAFCPIYQLNGFNVPDIITCIYQPYSSTKNIPIKLEVHIDLALSLL